MTVLTPGCGPDAPIVAGKDARAGTYQTKPTGKALHTFTLHNTSATATTRAAARLGLAFLKGDVPKGRKLAVWVKGGRRVPFSAAAATNSWADGSLRSTADGGLVLLDGSLGPGQSRTYEVHVVNGTAPASGFDPFAWLAAHGNDLAVAVTGRTGSATGAKPDLLFSLKTAIATTTRREILCDTDRFVRIKAWQKVPQEEHLICEYHVDFWLDEAGQPFGLEFAPVLSQHWWVADPFGQTQTKERYTYDAVVKYGTTALDSRNGLNHACHCRWASLRPQDDAQHARKHWIGLGLSQTPTVRVKYDDSSLKRMMKAGYIPPLRLGVAYANSYPATYAPLGPNGHRSGINDTGGYPGRGMWPDPDGMLISMQGVASAGAVELAWRKSRVMAQAALAVGWHVRDHRSTSGVNGGSDTTNRTIPHALRKISASYGGLAGPAVYSRFSSQTGSYSSTSGLTVLTFSNVSGGGGAFSSDGTIDNSHAVNYGGPMAFLDGEAYLGDATLSQFSATMWKRPFNQYASDRNLMHANTPRGNALGVPDPSDASHYGTLFDIGSPGQERELAWGLNLACAAWSICADARPENPLLKNLILNHDDWLSDSLAYFNSDQRARGGLWISSSYDGLYAPWMCHFQGLAAYQAARLFDFCPDNVRGKTGYEEGAEIAAQLAINAWRYAPQSISQYHSLYASDAANVTPLPLDEQPVEVACMVSGNVFTVSMPGPMPASVALSNGDKIRFLNFTTLPSGVTKHTLYYIRDVSGNTFRIATTLGGSALSVGNGSTPESYIAFQTANVTTPLWSAFAGDTRDMIAYALLEEAIAAGHPSIDSAAKTSIRASFAVAVAATTDCSTWNYDGRNME